MVRCNSLKSFHAHRGSIHDRGATRLRCKCTVAQRFPDTPVGEQFRFSLGVEHDFGEGKKVGLSYTFMYSPMEMDEVALPGGAIVDGEFDRAFRSCTSWECH